VRDVAARFLQAMERQDLCSGSPIIENVGSGQPRSLLQFATDEWKRLGATGKLLPGLVPIRPNEVMRYVPKIK
jgi:nucleoside-diphosphate-sugar epimerase